MLDSIEMQIQHWVENEQLDELLVFRPGKGPLAVVNTITISVGLADIPNSILRSHLLHVLSFTS